MTLQEFITVSLTQIVAGVKAAQEATAAMGARINPPVHDSMQRTVGGSSGITLQDVEFDVAVTVSTDESSKAGLTVGIPWLSAGVGGASTAQQSAVSRLKFVVPVGLPIPEIRPP